MNKVREGTILASALLVRVNDDEKSVELLITSVTDDFHAEFAKLSVKLHPYDYGRVLIIEAAGRMAAHDRTVDGAHLKPVN